MRCFLQHSFRSLRAGGTVHYSPSVAAVTLANGSIKCDIWTPEQSTSSGVHHIVSNVAFTQFIVQTVMSKKESTAKKAAAAVAAKTTATNGAASETTKKPSVGKANAQLTHSFNDVRKAVDATYKNYFNTLTPRLKLIDIFLVFLVALGGLQFVYVLLVGNFPFNAFLGGFIACVGQFVLTVSLRMQYAAVEAKDASESKEASIFYTISPERAFGEYIFASMLLHFIVFHFIN